MQPNNKGRMEMLSTKRDNPNNFSYKIRQGTRTMCSRVFFNEAAANWKEGHREHMWKVPGQDSRESRLLFSPLNPHCETTN